MKAKATLYQPNIVVRWRSEPDRDSMYGTGARYFVGQNPPPGCATEFVCAPTTSVMYRDPAGYSLPAF